VKRVRFLLPIVVTCALLAVLGVQPAGAGGGPGQDDPVQGYGKDPRFGRALKFCDAFHAVPRLRTCLIDQLLSLVVDSDDPANELPRIDAYVARTGGYLQANCHVLMHSVGRRYGSRAHVTLARLRDYLPRTNNANCSAGFGHGLLTYLAPELSALTPKQAAAQCNGAATRYQRYSCIHGFGHAYMRLYSEQLPFALHSCRLLGPANAPDCAAGAFHDYWIAVAGLDDTSRPGDLVTSPRVLCSQSSGGFVRGCWYRALLEHPPPRPVHTASDVRAVCEGLEGLQHSGCITAAAVISADDPFAQMTLCAALRDREAADCVRGVRAPELGQSPIGEQVKLIRGCANVVHAAQADCYRWLGLALNVVADGRFGPKGCPDLRFATTRARCRSGAAAYEGPLETFS
jgi:hypothetical protein